MNLRCIVALFAAGLHAQWFDIKTSGIPRLPDGKPDLNAPWPKLPDGHPDLSGRWSTVRQFDLNNILANATGITLSPAAAGLFKENNDRLGAGFMTVTCMPFGPVAMQWNEGGPTRIYQTPTSVAILFGNMAQRIVHLDGRPLPEDPNPAWMGYSIGHWEADTLVIESSGFREETWLDVGGHPHTERLRLSERLRRVDFGHLEYQATFADPEYYSAPLIVKGTLTFAADSENLEYVCHENERDAHHLIGRRSDVKPAAIAPEILARYAGTYVELGGTRTMTVTVNGSQLSFTSEGRTWSGVPLSEMSFSAFGSQATFATDSEGKMRFSTVDVGTERIFVRK